MRSLGDNADIPWRPVAVLIMPGGLRRRVEVAVAWGQDADCNLSGKASVADGRLRVVQERHEAKIHVQLLVKVEERQTGIIGHKIHFRFLIPAEH